MIFYVYIIRSIVDNTLYKGFTPDVIRRLKEHNEGSSRYTSKKLPWKLIYIEEFSSKTEALIREKQIKRANNEYIQWLITQPNNTLTIEQK